MKKIKLLITGHNGMLGKEIVSVFSENEKFDIYGISRNMRNVKNVKQYNCDLTDFKKLKIVLEEIKPNIIIHCAADTNVERCETNKEYSLNLNAKASQILAAYKPSETKYVYISTDSVFDGQVGNYKENNNANPLNYYALTKLRGEELSLKENPNSVIIRTNIYGLHKFEGTSLVEWALSALESNKSISGFDDVYFNPIYTKQLAKVIYELLECDFKGIINVGTEEQISKYDFLKQLSDTFQLNSELIQRASVDDMKFNAKRPRNTVLNVEKLHKLLNKKIKLDFNELYYDYKDNF